VHIGETSRDADAIRKNFRKSYIELLAEYQVFGPSCLAVHFTMLDKNDLAILHSAGAKIAVSPIAAAMKGFELPPLAELAQAEVPTALGSDWGPVRPWQALRLAAHIHARPALDLLRTHTAMAASYLGVGQEVGTIAPGMKADLVLVRSPFADVRAVLQDLDPPMMAEVLLQRVGESDVSDVMVNGEFYVREGNLLMYAEEDLMSDVRRLTELSSSPPVGQQQSSAVEPDDAPYEEGFRVVQREPATRPAGTILPLTPTPDAGRELPPSVRRIFGEDDV
jgi:5-methylthioadenosine/S-adenosylhomocysteine deaminase